MATLVVTSPRSKGGASDVRAFINDNLKYFVVTFVPSANYATGGDVIPAANMPPAGWTNTMLFNGWSVAPICPYQFQLDVANSKLKAFIGGAEATAAANLSTLLGANPFDVMFACR